MSKKRKFIQETNRTFSIMNPIAESIQGNVFRMSEDSISKFKSQLYTLVFTNKGERPMLPDFGTSIQSLLFEPLGDALYDSIRQDLIIAVKRWIPEISIDDVKFSDKEENMENSKIDLTIVYSLIADSKISDQIQIEMSM